jgi:hypothetical protein
LKKILDKAVVNVPIINIYNTHIMEGKEATVNANLTISLIHV